MNKSISATPIWLVGAVAAVFAAAVLYGYGVLAQALGMTMHAGEVGATKADRITPASFPQGVILCSAIGIVLAMALHRWAKRSARTFARVTSVLVAVSLAFPLLASHTTEVTRLTLAGGHLLAAAIMIPIVTYRLRSARMPAASRVVAAPRPA
jgi:hypothetical protein